ncbi:shikimate dehydrogenase [Arachidicoccus ginsenosidimutans]|uniref:shikimate dehydrogenase family protein n=1 Tax=Arachidicoccus sp. BS20 TaxID=1850526 RepID=UPI0007F0CC0D|nr:shikimate dehydrogenase [Arachidicoccus sp. BS20]ANI87856.1 shikimate dehydrogenase [Arachidicoccus sp. BS20]
MKKYGIIGYPLSHSFSQKYFTQKFIDEKIENAVFEKYEMPDISGVEQLMQDKELEGFCITIPHKKNIVPYLSESTDAVQKMGACNCVRIKNKKLFGYNTDAVGFEKSFIPHLQPQHTKALILGTGGAAAAVEFVLQKLNIAYQFVSRSKTENNFSYEELNENILKEYTIIVNCTPLGTFPKTDEAPLIPYQLITPAHYLYDLVYNPSLTKFLSLGKEKGAIIQNGYQMLVLQAEENWKIWNE